MVHFLRYLMIPTLCLFAAVAMAAESDVGIVLLHGKWDRPPTNVLQLARHLEEAGYKVATPKGNMQKAAATIATPTPLYMAVGSADTMAPVAESSIFSRAPKHDKSLYSAVSADHIGLASVIGPALVSWLRSLEY